MSRVRLALTSTLTVLSLSACATLEQAADRMAEPGRCTSQAAPGGGSTATCALWTRTTTTTTTTTTSPSGETSTTTSRTTTGDESPEGG